MNGHQEDTSLNCQIPLSRKLVGEQAGKKGEPGLQNGGDIGC